MTAGRAHLPVRDDLAGLEGYHSPQVPADVRLNTNESPYPPPPGWTEAFLEELATVPFHRYPDRRAWALRVSLAGVHGCEPDQVFVANGSNEVLQSVCLAYGGPGRRAAVFEPTYALHSHIPRLTGTEVVVGQRGPDFSLDLDEVARTLARNRPAVVFLCSPNNPTGMVDRSEATAQVTALAPGVVVVDEAYSQFAPASVVADVVDHGNLVVTRTFSKTWSMAALRLGYCVAPRDAVAALERVALPYHVDAASQLAGRIALRFHAEMAARVKTLVAERERLTSRLAQLPVDLWPSGANFMLFRPRERDGTDVWRDLLARSVLVRDCSSWPRLRGCLRVTVGTPLEDDEFLSALSEVLG